MGRLGRRPALPRHVTDLTSVDDIDGQGRGTDAAATVRATRSFGNSRHPGCRLRRARRLDFETDVDWHEREKFLKVGLPARRARRPQRRGDPVRPRLPPDPRQHQLGGGPVRDLRPPLAARRRARLGVGAGQRLDLRPRRHPHGARRRRHHRPRSGCPCCARRATPTRTPIRACTRSATRSCREPGSPRPSARAISSTCRSAASATGRRRPAAGRPWTTRRS